MNSNQVCDYCCKKVLFTKKVRDLNCCNDCFKETFKVCECGEIISKEGPNSCYECRPEETKVDEFKAQAEEVVTVMSNYLEAFVSTLDKHPELTERLGEVICRYMDVFMPAARKANSIVIEERKKAFKEFKDMGLSDELAAKMVCGR